jgi:hypothetical protein
MRLSGKVAPPATIVAADAAEIPRDPTSAVAARPTANFFDSFMYVFSSV